MQKVCIATPLLEDIYLYFHKELEDSQRTAKSGHLSALTLEASGPGVGLAHRTNLIFFAQLSSVLLKIFTMHMKNLWDCHTNIRHLII